MTRRMIGLVMLITIRLLWIIAGSKKLHMPLLLWWLRRRGMRIEGRPIYISALTWFDGSDYGVIGIGDKSIISSGVRVLTHDYAISRALEAIGEPPEREIAFVRPVTIGRNCFVGTYSILMPGTDLGDNVIVGAGSVVRGRVPADSIVAGNPAQIVGNTKEYAMARKHLIGGATARRDG